jgi:hypothetical protein
MIKKEVFATINSYYSRRKNDIFSLKNQLDVWHNCYCLCHLGLWKFYIFLGRLLKVCINEFIFAMFSKNQQKINISF